MLEQRQVSRVLLKMRLQTPRIQQLQPQLLRTRLSASQFLEHKISSHLGCLTLLGKVSTQHNTQTFTENLEDDHKIILPTELSYSLLRH